MIKEIKITDTLYEAEIIYLIGGTVEDLIDFIGKKHPNTPLYSWGSKFEWGEDANTTNAYQFHINAPLGKGEVFYVWMHELTAYLLGHETFHLTGDILFTRGIKYCEESEEAFAYLNGWLHQEFERQKPQSCKFLLRPSLIPNAGVGVFATSKMDKGELANIWDESDCRFVQKTFTDSKVCKNFRVEADGGWYIPTDFRRISLGWYLNHSDTPNLVPDEDANNYYANRNIKSGEELTIDYSKL